MSDTPTTTKPRLPADTHLGRIFLRVRDLRRETGFYRTALGLEVLTETDGYTELGVDARGLIGLIAAPDARPAPHAPGLYHLALLLPDRPALGAFLRATVKDRTRLQGTADHGVSEAVYLADLEGNGIEVYRDLPRSEWPQSGGEVEMITAPIDARGVLEAGQPSQGGFKAPAGSTLGHVHLQVSDLQRARERFHDVIGFDVTQSNFPGALFLSAGGYHHHIGLNTWGSAGRPAAPHGSLGLDWFEIVVPDVAARAALIERLAANSTSEDSSVGGPPARIYRDADGIGVAVAAG